MKKTGIVIIVLSLFVITSQAQNMQGQHSMMSSPGIQQIVVMYGDQLDITDDQLSEIIAKQLEYRETMRNARMQSNRANRGQQEQQGENYRAQHSQSILRSVLTESQMGKLNELMKDRANFSHRYTTIRHKEIVDRSGLEGEKRDAVLEMMNRHAEQRKELQLQRIENPQSMSADDRRQMMNTMRDDMQELRSILTVEEYENLMQFMGRGQDRPNSRMNQRPNNRRQN
ncbi:hypothetical protein [Rhodohalobacter halophilus]|uniref:hypothetical protein n=1 Tax=Rhodohalobacter halophilus TaxID=1812810 RepID=UPI00083FD7A2|nr:hypothetical protein [Rhodohalobacter halophilus]